MSDTKTKAFEVKMYLSGETRIESIDVSVHMLGDLIKKQGHVVRLLLPNVADRRTEEQFNVDLQRALNIIQPVS